MNIEDRFKKVCAKQWEDLGVMVVPSNDHLLEDEQ